MLNLNCRKHSFTLVEVIVVCSLFAIMVIWIIYAINRTFIFMDNTRLAVRASNLARGWVEMVYNLRDSNWRKFSSQRDSNWLRICPSSVCPILWNVYTNNNTYYILREEKNGNDSYIYAEPLSVDESRNDEFYTIEGFFSDDFSWERSRAKLNFTWTYFYYSWGLNNSDSVLATWNLADLLDVDWLEFYRVMRLYGVNCKTACSKDSDPRELRFCVKVFYKNVQWKHATELCSLMTNFME